MQLLLQASRIDVNHVNLLGMDMAEAVILGDEGAAHTEIVRLLLDHRADPNKPDAQGVTPLGHARQRGQSAVAARSLRPVVADLAQLPITPPSFFRDHHRGRTRPPAGAVIGPSRKSGGRSRVTAVAGCFTRMLDIDEQGPAIRRPCRASDLAIGGASEEPAHFPGVQTHR